jgi:hypothetical protein
MPLNEEPDKIPEQLQRLVESEPDPEPMALAAIAICPLDAVPLKNGICPCCHRTQEELLQLGGDLYPLKNLKKSLKRLAQR